MDIKEKNANIEKKEDLEKIGNITLDYRHYPGEDFYCDGTIEDELLEIVKNNTPDQFDKIIEERSDWPTLYHLSHLRENIVDWLPMDNSMKVLEVGSGCGAITGALARKAKQVTSIDLSKKRSLINAYRHKEKGNITIHVGNFKDIEPELPVDFDYIILIGVFEYGQGYMGTDTPYEDFMAILKKHLKPEGKMVIAIENKFGLKYWAGCKEDHLGTYFSGIEDYPQGGGVRTFTRKGLEKILKANDIHDYSFYYPYPDYKFMTSIYSDSYLPKVGELTTNLRNFDRDRMVLFDEKNVFDTVIREELFPLYSNSYLVVIGGALDVKFSKYSNEREEGFSIRTDIKLNESEDVYVEKIALTEESEKHIDGIKKAYDNLEKRYKDSGLKINVCEKTNKGIAFEFLQGTTFEEMLDNCLDKQDEEGFIQLLKEYISKIDYNENDSLVSDYDMIFSNIIINEDGWNIIDYEWTFYRKMDTAVIAYRAFYCYTLGGGKRTQLDRVRILETIGITQEEAEAVEREEAEFQAYVTGKKLPMGVMRDRIGHKAIGVDAMMAECEESTVNSIQIYPDFGQGYSEETSYFIEGNQKETSSITNISVSLDSTIQAVRIDPLMECCIVMIKSVKWNGTPLPNLKKLTITNGALIQEATYAFTSKDPNITWDLKALQKDTTNILDIEMDIVQISLELAEHMQVKKGFQKIRQGFNIRQVLRDRNGKNNLSNYSDDVIRQKNSYDQWIEANEKKKIKGMKYSNRKIGIIEYQTCGVDFNLQNTAYDYLVFLDNRGRQADKCMESMGDALEVSGAAILYGDEDCIDEEGNRSDPWFKPGWSPDTLLSFFYFGSIFVINVHKVKEIQWKQEVDFRINIYDFVLKVVEKSQQQPEHLDRIIYHRKANQTCQELQSNQLQQDQQLKQEFQLNQEQQDQQLQQELQSNQEQQEQQLQQEFQSNQEQQDQQLQLELQSHNGKQQPVVWGYELIYNAIKKEAEIRRNYPLDQEEGLVSIIIPSKDNPKLLEQCLSAITSLTDYPNYEIIVIDNGSSEGNKLKITELQRQYQFSYHWEKMEFNFSKMCNIGAKEAKGKFILLLNDDIEVKEQNWLTMMVEKARLPHIGAVGAKLLYPNSNRIQHVGITNLEIGPAHKLVNLLDENVYYYGQNRFQYDMIGVTAACLLIESSKYFKMNGFNEDFKIAYNDVDFCFRLVEADYYNLQCNNISLYHHESFSRGDDREEQGKYQRLLDEKDRLYARHPLLKGKDSFYSKHLIGNSPLYLCNFFYEYQIRKNYASVRKYKGASLTDFLPGDNNVTIESATLEPLVNNSDKKGYLIEGWSYLRDVSNDQYKRWIILEKEGEIPIQISIYNRYRKDVVAILPEQIHVELAGFVARIPKGKLASGTYQIGILAINKSLDCTDYTRTEEKLEVI